MTPKPDAEFTESARTYLQNTLNEVWNGFEAHFENRSRWSRKRVLALLQKLQSADTSDAISAKEAAVLMQASRACEEEFQEGEFDIRLGVTQTEAQHAVDLLKRIAAGAAPRSHATAS